jgi:hypothetical protein
MVEAERAQKSEIRSGILKCLMVTLLILVGVNIRYSMIAAAAFACIFILTAKPNEMLGMLVYFLSFATVFKLSPGGYTLFNFLIIAAIFRYFIVLRTIRLDKNFVIMVFVFALFVLLSGGTRTISELVKILMYFFLLHIIFQQGDDVDLRMLLFFFSLGIILSSLSALFSDRIPGLEKFMEIRDYRVGDEHIVRFGGLRSNSNYYTMPITIALSCLAGLAITKKAGLREYALIIILLGFGMSSISLSFLVSCICILLTVIFYLSRMSIKKLIFGLLCILLLFLIVYIVAGKEYVLSYIARISEKDLSSSSDLTTGRADLWRLFAQYLGANLKVLLFGQGLGAAFFRSNPHNTYLEALYYIGVVGLVLYALIIYFLFPRKHVKRNLVNYLPLLIFVIRGVAISYFLDEFIYFYILFFKLIMDKEISLSKKSTLFEGTADNRVFNDSVLSTGQFKE